MMKLEALQISSHSGLYHSTSNKNSYCLPYEDNKAMTASKLRNNRNPPKNFNHFSTIKLSTTSSASSGISSLASSLNNSPTSPCSSFTAKKFFEDGAIKTVKVNNRLFDASPEEYSSIPFILRSLSVDEHAVQNKRFDHAANHFFQRHQSQTIIAKKTSTTRIYYSSSFLMQMRQSPLCLHRPSNLPDLPVVLYQSVIPPASNSLPNISECISANRHGKSKSSKSSKSSSASSRQQSICSDSTTRRIINVNLSAEVKLHESENAWKAASINNCLTNSYEEELVKRLTSILNKLSNSNFEALMQQFESLDMRSEENMKICINVIFNKAITESTFSELYAKLTKHQAKRRAVTVMQTSVNFQDLMITRCQCEYEKTTYDRQACILKSSDCDITNDYLLKKKILGNIRFIGELFKQDLLQEGVLHKCIYDLLRSGEDEDNLESLCRLMTCIGNKLDHSKSAPRIKQYFNRISDILDNKCLTSRIRFMLLDLVDLKNNLWVPRNNTLRKRSEALSPTESSKRFSPEQLILNKPGLDSMDRHFNKLCFSEQNNTKVRPLLTLNGINKVQKPNNLSLNLSSPTSPVFKPTTLPVKNKQCTLQMFEKKCHLYFEEYINGEFEDVQSVFDLYQCESKEEKFCEFLVLFTFERSLKERRLLAKLIHVLLADHVIKEDSFFNALVTILGCLDDLIIDIPMVWSYIGDVMASIAIEDPHKYTTFLLSRANKQLTFDAALLQQLLDAAINSIMTEGGISEAVNFCLKGNLKNGFVTNHEVQLTLKVMHLETLKSEILSEMDISIVAWADNIQHELDTIQKKFCENFSISLFVRELSSKLFNKLIIEKSTNKYHVEDNDLKKCCGILKHFILSESSLELQVLYSIQALVHKLNHPFGLLRIFFDAFYDEDVVSEESFDEWFYSLDVEPQGKGVAKESVTQFFLWLHNDESDD